MSEQEATSVRIFAMLTLILLFIIIVTLCADHDKLSALTERVTTLEQHVK